MKVGLFLGNANFFDNVLEEFERNKDEVLVYRRSDDAIINLRNAENILDWADVVFFEFCFYPIAEVTKMESDTPIIVRMQGLEVYDEMLKRIDWRRVSRLIMTSPLFLRFSKMEVNYLPPIRTMQLGTDLEEFTYKAKEYGKNIGTVAVSSIPRKRLYTTLETFRTLLDRDDEWTLHIRTSVTPWRQEEQEEYTWFLQEALETLDLEGRVLTYDYIPSEEFVPWLGSKDIYISNAMQEGYCKTAIDAMACGTYTLVYKWLGADTVFPKRLLFGSQREMVTKILRWKNLTHRGKIKQSTSVHEYVKNHHDGRVTAEQVRNIMVNVVES